MFVDDAVLFVMMMKSLIPPSGIPAPAAARSSYAGGVASLTVNNTENNPDAARVQVKGQRSFKGLHLYLKMQIHTGRDVNLRQKKVWEELQDKLIE